MLSEKKHDAMSFAKLDDGYPDHPKILAAGPLAAWLHTCALCYCNRLHTDGFIPSGQIRKLADVEQPAALVQRLVEANLWEPCQGGYRVHDYLDHNLSADEIAQRREEISRVRAEAGRKGGLAKKQTTKQIAAILPGKQKSKTEAQSSTHTTPLPIEDSFLNPPFNPPLEAEMSEQVAPNGAGARDNFTEFAERCWEKYPRDLEGRQQGSKKKFIEQLRKLHVSVWDDFEQAIEQYAATDKVQRGYVKTAEIWVRDGLWKNYAGPPALVQRTNANGTHQQKPKSAVEKAADLFFSTFDNDREAEEGDADNIVGLRAATPGTPGRAGFGT